MDARPTTLLAELTHRCPLRCPYCSNPLELVRASTELATADWIRVFTEARALGVLQLGLSGGEPLLRRDLEEMIAHARSLGLYTTLVTSGIGLDARRAAALREAGLDHVQISLQAADESTSDRVAGARAWTRKLEAAQHVVREGFAFTINAVIHHDTVDQVAAIADLAAAHGADRLELANVQYYGWALANRDRLLPTPGQLASAQEAADAAATRYAGRMQVLYVLPDYYQSTPKPCMGGWGAVYLVVAPDGRVLPCHAAWQIDGLVFPSVRSHALSWIWQESPAFTAFRGTGWMRDPCRTCAWKERDHGGCRCQAFALTGDARNADPVCVLSPHRGIIDAALADATVTARASRTASEPNGSGYRYRGRPAESADRAR